MSKRVQIKTHLSWHHCVELRQSKRHGTVEIAGFKLSISDYLNTTITTFYDFYKMNHVSLFIQPSKTFKK